MAIMCRFHGGPKDGAEELLENAPERLVFPILPEPPIGYVRLEEAEKTSPTLLPRDACYERCGHLGGNAVADYHYA